MKSKKKANRSVKAKAVSIKDRLIRLESDVAQLLQIAYKGPPEAFGLAPIKREGGSTSYDQNAESTGFAGYDAAMKLREEMRGSGPCFIRVRFPPNYKEYTYRVRPNHDLKMGDRVIANGSSAIVTQVHAVPPCTWLRLDEHRWITKKFQVIPV